MNQFFLRLLNETLLQYKNKTFVSNNQDIVHHSNINVWYTQHDNICNHDFKDEDTKSRSKIRKHEITQENKHYDNQ